MAKPGLTIKILCYSSKCIIWHELLYYIIMHRIKLVQIRSHAWDSFLPHGHEWKRWNSSSLGIMFFKTKFLCNNHRTNNSMIVKYKISSHMPLSILPVARGCIPFLLSVLRAVTLNWAKISQEESPRNCRGRFVSLEHQISKASPEKTTWNLLQLNRNNFPVQMNIGLFSWKHRVNSTGLNV